jgi:tetratricopeptide (TPR) repeat protein
MVKRKDFPMKARIFTSALVLIMLSCSAYAQDWRGRARIRGVVLNEDGNPIPNVKVIFMLDAQEAKFELSTDKNGKWQAANIRGGEWHIDFKAEGYETRQISTNVSELVRAKPIEIRLKRTEKNIISENLSQLLAKGNELFNSEKYEEAIEEYQTIFEKNPEFYMIHKNLGNAYFELGNYDLAIEHYKLVLKRQPESTEILIALGNTYLEMDELEIGLNYFNQIEEEAISNSLIFYNIGTSFFNKGAIQKAVEYYSKALTLDPNLSDAFYQLGMCYININEKEKAKLNFRKYLQLAPDGDNAVTARDILKYLEK